MQWKRVPLPWGTFKGRSPENGTPKLGSTIRNFLGRFVPNLAGGLSSPTCFLVILAVGLVMAATPVALFGQEKPGGENKLLQLEPGKTVKEALSAGEKKSFQVTLA